MKLSEAIKCIIDDPFQVGCPVCKEMCIRTNRHGRPACAECPFDSKFMFEEFGMNVDCSVLREALKKSCKRKISRDGFIYARVKFIREMMMNLQSIGD